VGVKHLSMVIWFLLKLPTCPREASLKRWGGQQTTPVRQLVLVLVSMLAQGSLLRHSRPSYNADML
jgi:hypothetical protein